MCTYLLSSAIFLHIICSFLPVLFFSIRNWIGLILKLAWDTKAKKQWLYLAHYSPSFSIQLNFLQTFNVCIIFLVICILAVSVNLGEQRINLSVSKLLKSKTVCF